MSVKLSNILIPIDGSEFSMRAVDYGIVLAKKEENVKLVVLHVLFFREKSAISFMANLAGSQATFQIPEKLNLEIQQWFVKVREKAEQSQVQLRTDIVVSSKPVTRAIVAQSKPEVLTKKKIQ